ncbi:MAG: hypothetical protein ABI164_03095 [Acidobacteriaceae bacterium]
MRLGTEDKKKRLIAMVMVSLALTIFSYVLWNLASGPPAAAPPVAESSTPVTRSSAVRGGQTGRPALQLESAAALDPTLHPERMAKAENTTYTGTSRNIFSRDSQPPVAASALAIEKLAGSVRTGPVIPEGPPPPPPIDLKFYGFATEKGGRKLIFLSHGEDIFIAGEGDIVKGRYKVMKIDPKSVVIKDLSYNDDQTLALTTI